MSSVLIVGGGTWGCSTALFFARRGYDDVTVLDKYAVPSPISAGNDVNKMVEQGNFVTDEDDTVAKILLSKATEAWQLDPVFSPYYHNTGYIVAASRPEAIESLAIREDVKNKHDYQELNTAEQFKQTMPPGVLTGDFSGWKGWLKPTGAGWVYARKALVSAAKEAQKLGAKFVCGPSGEAKTLIVSSKEGNNKVLGVKCADGSEHLADTIIIASGALSETLVDLEGQLRPTAWTLAHIQMTEEEAKIYKDLPVLFNIEVGFFMEVDEDEHQLKMCDEHPGYCKWIKDSSSSSSNTIKGAVPYYKEQIPIESEQRLRRLLHDIMPHLEDRPFCRARLCWCADTPNRAFLIDWVPKYKNLMVACGGSGHGFMHIPTIGGYIVDRFEGKLAPEIAHQFRWRPETATNRDWNDTLGRYGSPDAIMDIDEVREWTNISQSTSI